VSGLLRSIWDEPRPSGATGPGWRDWALIAALIPTAIAEGMLRADVPMRALSIALAVALIPSLLWRRARPLLVVGVVFAVCTLAPALAGGAELKLNVFAFVLLLVYALFRWGNGREIVIGSGFVAARLAVGLPMGDLTWGDLLAGTVVLTTTMALGTTFRYRARARARELEQVQLVERERLARDLHDTVAHHVSAMAIRAQAGLATASSHPDAAADALRVIEAEASQALAEMRAMVRVLRHDQPADLTPQPRITDLTQLAGQSRPGPAVDVEVVGDVSGVPAPVSAAVFRLAQESVTNARRHARNATRIEVSVIVDESSVRLQVTDDGDPSTVRQAGSPGYGLVGMLERAGLLGGTFDAGPGLGRGWTVTAVLPRTAT
jgi:signal transduction histidine kinase